MASLAISTPCLKSATFSQMYNAVEAFIKIKSSIGISVASLLNSPAKILRNLCEFSAGFPLSMAIRGWRGRPKSSGEISLSVIWFSCRFFRFFLFAKHNEKIQQLKIKCENSKKFQKFRGKFDHVTHFDHPNVRCSGGTYLIHTISRMNYKSYTFSVMFSLVLFRKNLFLLIICHILSRSVIRK